MLYPYSTLPVAIPSCSPPTTMVKGVVDGRGEARPAMDLVGAAAATTRRRGDSARPQYPQWCGSSAPSRPPPPRVAPKAAVVAAQEETGSAAPYVQEGATRMVEAARRDPIDHGRGRSPAAT